MSNRLSAMGIESLYKEWENFAGNHHSAASKAWRTVQTPTDWTDATEPEYMRNLITCGWRMLDEELKANGEA